MKQLTFALALVALGSSASAQVVLQHAGQPADGNAQPAPSPQPQDPFVAPQPAATPAPQPAQAPAQERLTRQLSGYLSVPIMLTDGAIYDNANGWLGDAKAGFGIHGRFGWELGMLVLEGAVGWKILAVDSASSTLNLNLQDIWVGLGARLQFLNRSRVVPYASAAFVLNFLTATAAGASSADYEFNPGAQAAVGIAIELTRNLGIEVAVSGDFIFPVGSVFDSVQVTLQPWVGATLYI